jgi:hypothetical protein
MIELSSVRPQQQRIRLLQIQQGYNRKRLPFRSPEHWSHSQCASYRQALQQALPKRPLPELSAAPRQWGREIVDVQAQGLHTSGQSVMKCRVRPPTIPGPNEEQTEIILRIVLAAARPLSLVDMSVVLT